MQLNPSEISRTHQEPHPEPRRRRADAHAGHGGLGDRRHLPHPRPLRRDAGRDARVPEEHLRPRAESGARLGRRGDAGRVQAHHRGRHGQDHGQDPVGADRPRAARARGELARPADRRQGPDQREAHRRDREGRAGRDRAPVGVAAGADRLEGDRRDGADRPRPARAHHRRPPDRQDRGGGRHDHQPEGQGSLLRLRRDRAEGFDHRQRGAQARGARRDGLHHRGGGLGLRVGGDAVHRAVLRLHHGRVLPRPRPGRAHHLRRPDQAGLGVPPGVAAPAPAARARGLSRGRVLSALAPARARGARQSASTSRSSPRARSRARPARSPRCRSSRPRPAT